MDAPERRDEMKSKLGWLALVAALAVPAATAWAVDAKGGGAAKADAPPCCPCCCHHACPK
jgi:hypothetical protein